MLTYNPKYLKILINELRKKQTKVNKRGRFYSSSIADLHHLYCMQNIINKQQI